MTDDYELLMTIEKYGISAGSLYADAPRKFIPRPSQ